MKWKITISILQIIILIKHLNQEFKSPKLMKWNINFNNWISTDIHFIYKKNEGEISLSLGIQK